MIAAPSQALSLSEIAQSIHFLRGQKVMLDSDLARLYRVETKALNRAVQRNRDRFPADFMFRLTAEEQEILRCQIGTLKSGRGKHRKYSPYAFTEQGVAMLSSVLRSKRAVLVNIEIVRAFVRLREILSTPCSLENSPTWRESTIVSFVWYSTQFANSCRRPQQPGGQLALLPTSSSARYRGRRKPRRTLLSTAHHDRDCPEQPSRGG